MPLIREWFSAAELAEMALPGIPTEKRNVLLMADREEWRRSDWRDRRWRLRRARGGGHEYHFSVLPNAAQAMVTMRFGAVAAEQTREAARRQLQRDDQWRAWEQASDKKKAKAQRKLGAVQAVEAMLQAGTARLAAVDAVGRVMAIPRATLYRWLDEARCVAPSDQLAALAPRHAGRGTSVECSPDAWQWLLADYLRLECPAFSDCYRRLCEKNIADGIGWAIPARTTLQRRVDDLPEAMKTLYRHGTEAVKRMYPAQERDRSCFGALEAVNADGHKWDVFVRWDDGHVGRPVMVAIQDLYSGLILSWRVDRTENKEAVRLAFGDVVERYGIPSHCWLDNGRNFASKWLTGGTPNRYRWKVRDEDPQGILTSLGVTVHWTTPYSGQSKPIERAFRDLAGGLAKHPAFAGAYTGNTPMAKPENYGEKVVPIERFIEVVNAGIAEHNSRVGRRSRVCAGKLSFQAAFDASYAAPETLIRKATAEQRRLWLLAAEGITVQSRDGAILLGGNRYWSDLLHPYRGQRVVVRYDPQALQQDLHVYRMDGVYIGAAACVAAEGFADVDAARRHAQKRRTWVRSLKQLREAEGVMDLDDLVAAMPKAPQSPPPAETKVVRLVRAGNTVREVATDPDEEIETETDDGMTRFERLMLARPRVLQLVPNEDQGAAD